MRYTIFVLGNKIPHQFINNSCILPQLFYFQYHLHSHWVHYIGLDHLQNLCSIQGIQFSEAIIDAKIYINRRSKNRGSRGINCFPKFLRISFYIYQISFPKKLCIICFPSPKAIWLLTILLNWHSCIIFSLIVSPYHLFYIICK